MNITSIQPFEIEWGVIKSNDPFLKTKVEDPFNNPEMKTALDKSFKVWTKIRNMSTKLPIQLNSTKLSLKLVNDENREINLLPENICEIEPCE